MFMMADTPLELAVGPNALAHWLTTGQTLVVATPHLGQRMKLDPPTTAAVWLTQLPGTPARTFNGLLGAALSVALRRGGLLLAVLVLPLTVPVLIFGVSASNAAIVGPVPFGTPFTILCALTLVSLVVGIFAAAAALRQGLE
jgi:heme exporter protein B